ncbi:hypothetical protein TRFO_10384 [Tritrichomonas foetus]|uniref:Protein regulator of cytokinesis 1 n=1 Tax=Tritrichomonas foetus TaxID=1144522 RepID=A0A1J4JEP3_9EUKA|nr:hypothetical protein TRFO_10384 [Tritrichomonas foetus]|eukprot:OHS95732.1 hypothetical protein TRFO_10384 [Tritrichomonas foetus]
MDDLDFIQITISPQLSKMWDKLGLRPEERDAEFSSLQKLLINQYNIYLQTIQNRVQGTQDEVSILSVKLADLMKAYGYNQEEIDQSTEVPQDIPLLQKLQFLKANYETFQQNSKDRISKMESTINVINQYFDALEYPEELRGEYTTLGSTDLTRERLRRLSQKLDELKIEKQRRIDHIGRMKEKINDLAVELSISGEDEITQILRSNSVSASSMNEVENCLKKLTKLRADRVDMISQFAVEITHLWDALQVPQNERDIFLAQHSTLGSDVIDSCVKEIQHLTEIRDSQKKNLLESQKAELTSLWDSLHIPQELRILPNGNEIFGVIEQEIIRWKQFWVENHDLIETINKREKIIADFEACKDTSADPQRLTLRTHEGAKRLLTEEKIRKIYKSQLPKLDKKLIKMLRQYKKKKGEDFFWDGKPYISRLSTSVLRNEGIDNIARNANLLTSPKTDCHKYQTLPRKYSRPNSPRAQPQLGSKYFSFIPAASPSHK